MKISVKEKMKEAEQMSLQYPDVLYRVMDKTGQRAIVTGNSSINCIVLSTMPLGKKEK